MTDIRRSSRTCSMHVGHEMQDRRLLSCMHKLSNCLLCSQRTTSFLQILWTFSIYLEALAILPQLVMLWRTQNIDNLTGNYVFLLG